MKVSVSVIIPNYNGVTLLKKSLPSVVKAYANKKNRIKEIIIVDDCSEDKSVKYVRENFPQIKVVRHKVNRGFAASINTGARSSKGKYLVLLNNDVIPEINFLESTFLHFRNKEVFAISFHEEGYDWAKGRFERGFIVHEPGGQSSSIGNTFWVSGGSGMFRRDAWMKLGGFDESLYQFYWEDIDLSYRALKRGYRLLWDPDAKVVHKHGTSTQKVFSKKELQRMQERNQLRFIWKNLTSPILFRKHIVGLFGRLSRHPGYIRVVFSALLGIKRIRAARVVEKKESKVSDEAIFAEFD